MAKNEIYSDGVSNIHWVGNMVKLDLVSYNPTVNVSRPWSNASIVISNDPSIDVIPPIAKITPIMTKNTILLLACPNFMMIGIISPGTRNIGTRNKRTALMNSPFTGLRSTTIKINAATVLMHHPASPARTEKRYFSTMYFSLENGLVLLYNN